MSEELSRELIDAIKTSNSFSWDTMISILALVASWITIMFLIKDKIESKKPYAQISFELVRDNLACLVIRNVGNVPLTLRSLRLDDKFIKQIGEDKRETLINKENISVNIFPGKMWVLCLGVAIHEIMKYETKTLHIDYAYSKKGRKHLHIDDEDVDFDQYRNFMLYISEIDELKNVNKKIGKNIEKNTKELEKIHTIINRYATLEDSFSRYVIDKETIT